MLILVDAFFFIRLHAVNEYCGWVLRWCMPNTEVKAIDLLRYNIKIYRVCVQEDLLIKRVQMLVQLKGKEADCMYCLGAEVIPFLNPFVS